MNNVFRLLAVYLLFASVALCQAEQKITNPNMEILRRSWLAVRTFVCICTMEIFES